VQLVISIYIYKFIYQRHIPNIN